MNKRFSIIAIFLLITGVLTFYFNKDVTEVKGEFYAQKIPKTIGKWHGIDFPVEPLTIAILETEDILNRKYILDEKNKIILSVVFSNDNRRAVHPPEVCYRASGWEIESKHTSTLHYTEKNKELSLEVTEVEAFKRESRIVALYWYKSGPNYTANFFMQQLNVVISQLLNRKSPAALISISMLVTDGNIEDAFNTLIQFAQLLAPYISEYIP